MSDVGLLYIYTFKESVYVCVFKRSDSCIGNRKISLQFPILSIYNPGKILKHVFHFHQILFVSASPFHLPPVAVTASSEATANLSQAVNGKQKPRN
ncbi:hypothetical protein CEXT_548971 [Caerostris extrusa]|uniref:Uncharacterized protein n=1 Tax=Caerostris extrusa TaxID=172846 RepID=A0AAV4RB45_CAEEX|nr:hypothetical protein CEXT_548971 [Caerostris extrusa]